MEEDKLSNQFTFNSLPLYLLICTSQNKTLQEENWRYWKGVTQLAKSQQAFAINIGNHFQHSTCWSYNRCCRSLVCCSSNAVGIVSWHKRHSVFKKQSALSLYSFSWLSFYFMWDNCFLLSTQQHQNEGDHSSWNEKLF